MSVAIDLIPVLIRDCHEVKEDLETLEKMAEIFAHPIQLAYKVGKNLIVNGIDIYAKIEQALDDYKKGNFFCFGQHIGEALNDVFFKAPFTKKPNDEKAYYFLVGFFRGINMESDNQRLYNNIDDMGMMIYMPVDSSMKQLSAKQDSQAMWSAMHEISHVFLEGALSLRAKDAITEAQQEELQKIGQCLNSQQTETMNSLPVQYNMHAAFKAYMMHNDEHVGYAFAQIANSLCENKFLV